MTSDDTHAATAALLAANSNWGLPSSQLHLLKQEKVPCFADGSGALALEATDGLALLTKPHGHGDVHALLHSSGVASELLSRGVAHLVFFQVESNPQHPFSPDVATPFLPYVRNQIRFFE
jgi:UDP-sugar pyrophosphorylase